MTIEIAIQALRLLNQSVFRPPRLPTEAEVNEAEHKVGFPFHPDYRKYLLEASDVTYGILEPATITEEDNHTYLVDVAHHGWGYGVTRSLLPICEDNANFYCMSSEGEVIYWSHDGSTNEKWANLATWILEVWIGEYQES